VQFKPRAYQKAARTIESLSESIEEIYNRGELTELPGVGEHIAEKIEELIKTGKLNYYTELKKKLPMDVEQLGKVPGMGPKRIKLLYETLAIKNLNDLKEAAQLHQIRTIKGLGEKVEADILKGIGFADTKTSRFLLGYVMPLAEEIKTQLEKLEDVSRVEIAGSYRRRKETIGDIDILAVSSKPQHVMDYFVHMKEVSDVLAHGSTKSSVRLHNGLQIDLRVVKEREFGSALQYFTGNKEHNVELRKIALKKGFTLNEYGLFTVKRKKWIAGKTEEDIYRKLGVLCVPPEMRENVGELELKNMPSLIAYGDAQGDFQMHTTWSDGQDSIDSMAKAASALGWKFITITDHVGQVGITKPLTEKRLEKQALEIAKLNKKLDIRIFHGAEVDILKDGTLALSKAWQKKLDVVLASVHLATKMGEKEMTRRLCTALEHERVHILGHPTGRLLEKRKGYAVNLDGVFDCARRNNVFLDIDCHPERMDLSGEKVKAAKENGCSFAVSTDAHSIAELKFLHLGEAIARRGWLEKKDVLNMYPVNYIEKKLGGK
ncbi:DNA polymerase/3'-5' exonuclease PolX, partial [Candidatus Woesearchaeota archaeon]|nr:DNA polymerase/3'-5' exonuclease PolX [Candidatus Woesearchaeota archaeon]